jgi:hypothetical protein
MTTTNHTEMQGPERTRAMTTRLSDAEFYARGIARSRYHDRLFMESRPRPSNEQFDEGWDAAKAFYTDLPITTTIDPVVMREVAYDIWEYFKPAVDRDLRYPASAISTLESILNKHLSGEAGKQEGE